MEEPEDLRWATELWQEAYRNQMDGELDRAMERYERSIEVYPTAEAHTFLGWALSVQGRLEEATDECRRAIEIDPQFGNPYNDIGVYLTQQGKPDEAIPWLEQAKQATRYEPRHPPTIWRAWCRSASVALGQRHDSGVAMSTSAPHTAQRKPATPVGATVTIRPPPGR